jgi:hypothetical protein
MFSMIKEFFSMVIDFVVMIVNSLVTLFQMLTTGIPAVLKSIANMPSFIISGVTVTISICLCMVLLGRRSS